MKKMTIDIRDELKNLICTKALEKREVILSSGKKSSYYLDLRRITLNGSGAAHVGTLIARKLAPYGFAAVGGMSIGADPVVVSAIMALHVSGREVNGFLVRSARKGHGMQRLVEGPALAPDCEVALVDDVLTTGGSLLKAADALKKEYPDVKLSAVCVLVDRDEGGRENLQKLGCPILTVYTARELLA